MGSKILGILTSALFVLVVVAVAMRIGVVKNLVFGAPAAAA
jgi:hypothetical protein